MSKTLRQNVSRKNKNSKKHKINNMRGGVLSDYIINSITRLSQNDPTLKVLIVSYYGIDDVEGEIAISEALKINTILTTLIISNISVQGTKALSEALKTNRTLTNIDMSINRIGDEGAKALAEALKSNTALTSLNISRNYNIGVAGAKALAEALKLNTTLTTLNISENNKIGVEGAEALANALGKDGNKTLTTLDISGNNIGVEGAIAIAEALKVNTTLTTLNISYNNISYFGAGKIAKALENNITLTTLDISNNEIMANGGKCFANMLKTNKTLLELNICNNYIGKVDINNEYTGGAEVLAEALGEGGNTTLTSIDMSENMFNNAEALSNMIKNNKTLTNLSLHAISFFSDDAVFKRSIEGYSYFMQDLIKALKYNTSLLELDIRDNKIGNEGANALAVALGENGNTTLRRLYVNNNYISHGGIQDFANMIKFNNSLSYIDMDGLLFRAFRNNNNNELPTNLRIIRDKLESNIESNKKKNHSKRLNLVNNVTSLAALYSGEEINKFFINGVKLQDQYKSGLRHLTYNSQEGILSLKKEDNTNSKTNNLQNIIKFFKTKLSITSKNTKNTKNTKRNNRFFKTNNTRSDEAILSLLLYFPLIKSFANNKDLILNLQTADSGEIMHYIEIFDKIVTKNSQQKLPPEIWHLIFSYLTTNELEKFKKALTF